MTATEIRELQRQELERRRKAAEAMIAPVVDKMLEIAGELSSPVTQESHPQRSKSGS